MTNRKERACRSLPMWALRRIVESKLMCGWWSVARIEIWRREVESEIEAAVDLDSGPWPCVMPGGRH